jgi:hypothetical protein
LGGLFSTTAATKPKKYVFSCPQKRIFLIWFLCFLDYSSANRRIISELTTETQL